MSGPPEFLSFRDHLVPLVTMRPHVSVLMIAYNVQEYIEQAIESVLMQEVDFPYEIVIGEDCSTDQTREILKRYARRHPDRIRTSLRERNLGMNANFFATYRECRGRFIALLDGDDYWTSPHKLQRQVAFLEAHPQCAICFHNAMVVYEDRAVDDHPFHSKERNHRISARVPETWSGLPAIAPGNFLQTGSVMYRGGLVPEVPDWCVEMPTFDWPLHLLHAEHGTIGYIDEVLSAYRVREGAFWSTGMSRYRRLEDVETMIRGYELISRHLEGQHSGSEFDRLLRPKVAPLHQKAMKLALADGDEQRAAYHATKFLSSLPAGARIRQRSALQVAARGRAPRLYQLLKSVKSAISG